MRYILATYSCNYEWDTCKTAGWLLKDQDQHQPWLSNWVWDYLYLYLYFPWSERSLCILFLDHVALIRGIAGYSHQTFPWAICRSVCRCVRLCIGLSSALWKNGGSDPDDVWHPRSDVSRDEACIGVWDWSTGRGSFAGEFGARHCNHWGLTFAATHPSSQITMGRHVIYIHCQSGVFK